VSLRVASSDPTYTECLLRGSSVSLDVVAEEIPQAATKYETDIVHYVQTYTEPEGGGRKRALLPQNLAKVGTEAAWVPGQRKLLATNATGTATGIILTIVASGPSAGAAKSEGLARAVAVVTLARAADTLGQ
jgi:hypothetical protein